MEQHAQNINIRRSLRYALLEGSFGAPIFTISSGVLLTGFALFLGATPFEISIIVALPFLTQLIQIIGPAAIDRIGSRKKLTAHGILYSRLVWLIISFLPLMLLVNLNPVPLFILLLTVSLLLFNLAQNSWLTWMSDLVPPKLRGRFFGKRNMYIGLLSMIILIGAGLLLDVFKNGGAEGLGYSILIIVSVIFAYFGFRYTMLMDDAPKSTAERIHIKELLQQAKVDHKFKSILLFLSLWTIITGIAAPFYYVHLYENMHWSYGSATLYASITGGLQLLLQPFWGKLLDRVGHKPLLKICIAVVSVIPVIWIVLAPAWSGILWGEAFISGTMWAGLNITLFNIVLYSLPGEKKAPALALLSSIVGVLNFGSMLLGGLIVASFSQLNFMIGAWSFSPFQITFFISFLGRIVMVKMLKYVQEPEAKDVSVVAQIIQTGIAKRVNLGRGFWVFRRKREDQIYE